MNSLTAHSAIRLRPVRRGEAQLLLEASKAQKSGHHFVATLFASLAETLWHAPALARVIEDWRGDLAHAGVIFRLNAGLHALARGCRFPPLTAVYAASTTATVPNRQQLDAILAEVLREGEDDLLLWLTRPTQTNEVARIAGLAAALMDLSHEREMPCRLLELGCSAGLNLNLAHYDVVLGGARMGSPESAVHIAPQWYGKAPLPGVVRIAEAKGVDLNPLDITCDDDAERLQAYIWPGERERSERLCNAMAVARQHPPRIEQGSAAVWLSHQLAGLHSEGERRVVFHSMVTQYLPDAERLAIDRLLANAGRSASPDRPLARVGLEWNEQRTSVEVWVTQWDGSQHSGFPRLAARCHPYAEWFEWLGVESGPATSLQIPFPR